MPAPVNFTISGVAAAGAAVAALALNNGGSGYTSAPTVTISGGGGSGATATATLAGRTVASLTITNGGSGYTSVPTISFSGGGGSGAAATAVLAAAGVASVTVSAGGSNVFAPSIAFSGGGGTGAAAVAVMGAGVVHSISPNLNINKNYGYGSSPTVSFSGGGGSGAAATANLSTSTALAPPYTLVSGGSGYSSAPAVSFTGGGGSGATAICTIDGSGHVNGFQVTAFGSGYTSAPTVVFTGGGGSGAAVTVFLAASRVISYTITNAGSGYTSVPTVSLSGGSPTEADDPTCLVNQPVASITVTNAGSGYTSAPTVLFLSGSGQSATAVLASRAVASATVTAPGSGYTSAPSVSFSGGGGTGAAATAVLAPAAVFSLSVTAGGSGYTSAPDVAFSGGSGSGAEAAAELDDTVSDATFTSLGLSALKRTRRSLALDEVTFQKLGAPLDEEQPFPEKTTVTIKRDGTVIFVGRVTQAPRSGSGREENCAWKVAGTWWYFENLVYQQIWPLDAAANSHLTSPATYRRAVVIAGMASITGLRQNVKDFIVDVLDYLIASNAPAVTQYEESDLPAGFDVPFKRLDSPTAAAALQWITRFIADAASFFDYEQDPPQFNLHRRADADTLEFDVTEVHGLDLTPRPDLLLEKLVIQFVTLDDNGFAVLHEDKSPSTATGREWGAAVITLDNNYRPLPTGLAANYRAGLGTLQYAGSFRIEEQECSQVIRPGHLVNITGGKAAWETMAAQVVEVTEDFDRGITQVTVGPPNRIRLDDLTEVMRIASGQSDEFGGGDLLKVGGKSKNVTLTTDFPFDDDFSTIATQIATAVEEADWGTHQPRAGDIVFLEIDGVAKFKVHVHDRSTTISGKFVFGFTRAGVTYYANAVQLGIL